jgi:hypothetical protein
MLVREVAVMTSTEAVTTASLALQVIHKGHSWQLMYRAQLGRSCISLTSKGDPNDIGAHNLRPAAGGSHVKGCQLLEIIHMAPKVHD